MVMDPALLNAYGTRKSTPPGVIPPAAAVPGQIPASTYAPPPAPPGAFTGPPKPALSQMTGVGSPQTTSAAAKAVSPSNLKFGSGMGRSLVSNPQALAGAAGAGIGAAVEGYRAVDDIRTGGLTGLEKVARGAEAAGRWGSAGAGAGILGQAGLLAGGPLVGLAGGVIGGGLGYFAPEAVRDISNRLGITDGVELASQTAAQNRGVQAAASQPAASQPAASPPAAASQPTEPLQFGDPGLAARQPDPLDQAFSRPAAGAFPADMQSLSRDVNAMNLRGMQRSDAGLPYQTDPNTGVISIRNTDGSGSGTMDFGSPERNAEMAAKLSDRKGTANFIPQADMNNVVNALNQRSAGQGMSGGASPEMQAFRQMQMASGPQVPDQVSQLINQLQRVAPSRFDSVGGLIAKKGQRRGLESALQGAVAARGQDTQAGISRERGQQRAGEVAQMTAQRQAEAQMGQQAAQQRMELDMQKQAVMQAKIEQDLEREGFKAGSADFARMANLRMKESEFNLTLEKDKREQQERAAQAAAAGGMVKAQQNAPMFGTSEEQKRADEELARTHSGAYTQSLYRQR